MVNIPEVSDLQIAFGGDIDKLLPAWDDLPEEYHKGWTSKAPGCQLAEQLFFKGGRLPPAQRRSGHRQSVASHSGLSGFL